ncbi:MAG: beta-ketoacyl-ACP synthase III [candidate division WOR-3 bacterium]|nr:beta-ketoacyl-ACP synthase III [candidate division WOR-3 bacterium]
MSNLKILGTGSYLPEKILTNFDMEKIVDTSDEWITKRTGIKERHIAADDEATSDLGLRAAEQAITDAGISKEDIDMIIFGTITPDRAFPSTAIYIQKALGLAPIPAFDVSAACPGYIYAMYIADKIIKSRAAKHILLLGGECLTRIIDWEDRGTCVLFGDGVGASIVSLSESENEGLLSITIGGDGSMEDLLYQPAGGSRMPASHETVEKNLHTIQMKGNEVYKNAVNALTETSQKAIEMAGVSVDDITHFIPHQANIRIMETTAKYLGIDREKVYVNIDRTANTSAGTIPIAMDEMNRKGMLKKGDLILISSFGGGFVWGSGIIRW